MAPIFSESWLLFHQWQSWLMVKMTIDLLIDDSMVSVMMVMLMFWWIWWVYWCWFMMNMRIDVCRLMYSAFTEVFIQRQHTQCPSLCLMEGEPHYICFRYVFLMNILLYLCWYFDYLYSMPLIMFNGERAPLHMFSIRSLYLYFISNVFVFNICCICILYLSICVDILIICIMSTGEIAHYIHFRYIVCICIPYSVFVFLKKSKLNWIWKE